MATPESEGGSGPYRPPHSQLPEADRALHVTDVAALTGLSAWTIYDLVRRRAIPHFKISNRLCFSRDEVIGWRDQHRVEVHG